MKHAVAAVLLSAVALLRIDAQAPPRDRSSRPQLAAIRGRIVSGDSDTPVRKARVTLVAEAGGAAARDPIYSDADGRFEFLDVVPGRYSVGAWKSGFAPARFGAGSPLGPAIPIVARAGQATDDVEIRLVKGGAISGRVVDEFGDPMAGWSVTVGRPVLAGGRARVESTTPSVQTDDLGEYRVGGLPAGTFVVGAFGFAPFRVASDEPGAPPRVGVRPSTIFYPDAGSMAHATSIVLHAGEETSGIDVTIGATPRTFTISGRVIDPEAADASSVLSATTDGGGIREASGGATRAVPPSGEFTMVLDAGEYSLVAQNGHGIAMQHLSLEANISDLQLTLSKAARISGRVVFEGVAARPSNVLVEAASNDDGGNRLSRADRVGASGTFTLTNVIGTRELRVSALPGGWTVKSITSGGRSIADVPIDFKGGEDLRDVVIVLTDRIAALNGTVVDPRQQPVPGASVIVFAEDRRQLPRRARWVRSDITGHFVISDLPAGEYRAVTADEVDEGRWQTAEYLEAFRARAVHVTLAAGESATLALPRSPAR
jgi:hypothetical protein